MIGHLTLAVLMLISPSLQISSQLNPGQKCFDAYGNKGRCRSIYLCPEILNTKVPLISQICSLHWSGPIVCCPTPSKIIPETTTAISPTEQPKGKPGDKAKHWCRVYSKVSPKIVHIIGGEVAKPEEFPHMAAVGFGPLEDPVWSCGGSLISENFILTAAHCLDSPKGPAKWVRLGAVDLENSVDGQTHPVIRRIRHPRYNYNLKYNDVALLEIGDALESHALPTVSKDLHPICLPSLETPIGRNEPIATGWGQTEFGGDPSPLLLKVGLSIFNNSLCHKTYINYIKPGGSLEFGIDDTMICAGQLCGGKDTCKGDSGGPLQVRIRHSGMYEILGITSFGSICGCKNSPSVYMNVAEYVEWIESIVWPSEV